MSALRSIYRRLRRGYQRVFERQEDARTRAIADVLERVPIFQELSRSVLRDVAEIVHRREYRRDEYLYYENDPGMGLYIIEHGTVRLLAEDEEGGVYEIHQEGRGAVIGLLSLLHSIPRMETAQAMTDTQVLGFFRPDLNALLKRHPRGGSLVISALARHLAERQVEVIEVLAAEDGPVEARKKLYASGAVVGT